jgi:hypothetical protein
MDNEYILKHKNTDIAEFRVERYSNNVDYLKILDDTFSPVNAEASEVSQIISFNGWITDRCISNSRDGAERLKYYYKIDDMRTIMLAQYGLSLSDHYWIDREPFNNKWENINFYENRYDEVLGKVLFDKKIKLANEINMYGYKNPNVTTGGNLKKYWKYNNGDNINYLVKGGSKPDLQEPFNEYYAHLLLQCLEFEHTPYNLEKYEDEYVSICPCIADINKEMISAVNIQRKYGIEKTYNGIVNLGKKQGCLGFEDEINKMIILDYFIDNIDRHWNNFGILRNSETGLWIGNIPIYDNGYSLWNRDFVDNKIISESMSFAHSNEECLKYVNIEKYIKELPDMVKIFDIAFEQYENKERKEKIRAGIIEKMETYQDKRFPL